MDPRNRKKHGTTTGFFTTGFRIPYPAVKIPSPYCTSYSPKKHQHRHSIRRHVVFRIVLCHCLLLIRHSVIIVIDASRFHGRAPRLIPGKTLLSRMIRSVLPFRDRVILPICQSVILWSIHRDRTVRGINPEDGPDIWGQKYSIIEVVCNRNKNKRLNTVNTYIYDYRRRLALLFVDGLVLKIKGIHASQGVFIVLCTIY